MALNCMNVTPVALFWAPGTDKVAKVPVRETAGRLQSEHLANDDSEEFFTLEYYLAKT